VRDTGTIMNNLNKILISIAGIITISVIIIVGASFIQQQQANDEPGSNDDTKTGDNGLIAASVNGINITYDQVISYQQSYIQQGQNITEKQALERLIDEELLLLAAHREPYIPTKQEAEQQLQLLLSQQNLTLDDYKSQLQLRGITYEAALQDYMLQLEIQNYEYDVLNLDQLNVSDQEVLNYYQMYQNQSQEEIPQFQEIKEQIRSYLLEQKRQEEINSLIQELRKEAEIIYY